MPGGRGRVAGSQPRRIAVHRNFEDLTPYLTFEIDPLYTPSIPISLQQYCLSVQCGGQSIFAFYKIQEKGDLKLRKCNTREMIGNQFLNKKYLYPIIKGTATQDYRMCQPTVY